MHSLLELRTLPNELLTVDILLSIKYYTWKEICGLSSASTRTQNVHSMHGREQRVPYSAKFSRGLIFVDFVG